MESKGLNYGYQQYLVMCFRHMYVIYFTKNTKTLFKKDLNILFKAIQIPCLKHTTLLWWRIFRRLFDLHLHCDHFLKKTLKVYIEDICYLYYEFYNYNIYLLDEVFSVDLPLELSQLESLCAERKNVNFFIY